MSSFITVFEASSDSARVEIDVPDRARLRSLKLRLRLPHGKSVAGAFAADGRRAGRVLADRQTIELPHAPGRLELEVRFR